MYTLWGVDMASPSHTYTQNIHGGVTLHLVAAGCGVASPFIHIKVGCCTSARWQQVEGATPIVAPTSTRCVGALPVGGGEPVVPVSVGARVPLL